MAALAVSLAAGPAPAQELADALRPCTRADVIGTWEVVRLGAARGTRVDRSHPYYYRHQRLVFDAGATAHHLTSTKAITAAQHRALLARPPTHTWAVDGQGRLLLQKEGAPRLEATACGVLNHEVVEAGTVTGLPGDLLITHFDGNQAPVLRRQLRRITIPDE